MGRILGLVAIALIAIYFVGKPSSQQPEGGSAALALEKGKKIYDAWTNPETREKIRYKDISGVIDGLKKVPETDPLYDTARHAAQVLAPAWESALKRESARLAAEKVREEQFQRNVIALTRLKRAMHDPRSFEINQILRMKDGALCVSYRAANAFNAIRSGQAVIDTKRIRTSNSDGFSAVWNRHCANKTGEDVTYMRRGLL